MSNQLNRERQIFEAALELTSSEARSGYLLGACGDDLELRKNVEALLRAHEQASGFLPADDPKPPSAATTKTIRMTTGMFPVTEKAGDQIGRYKLREKIGEGGCGVVYVADQEQPVRRRVALKVIKLGMDTKSVIARFEAERQALAMMDHPNIAKVLDAGATETGRPYFVMELVRGIRITDYCDQNKLPTRERLDLFIKVCQAVQHAHQKGIIHRDLKPSNILVTLHDGVPVPKIIDFGISKATEGRLTDLTVYTELNQFIGTPAYMSPEQAEMSGLDIDTRSDIYSLGVLLYELLTGGTPFDATELVQSGLDAMRKTIREKDPVRPSTRLNTMLATDLTTVAHRHGAEPPKLVHLVKGDLDWIVMKSLEKDRTRRYETANGLAADLNRHLNNEPITARPPSSFYRFQKMVRRNKLAFAAVSAVLLSLMLGLGFSSWQAIRARKAEREQSRLRGDAEKAQASESKERTASEQRLYDLLVKNAEALRQQHRVGYRDDAFDFLKQANAIDVPQKSLSMMRSEAIACMGDFVGFKPIVYTNFPEGIEISEAYVDLAGQVVGFRLSDGTIQLRKLPSGEELDWLKSKQPAFSFCFSPAGDQIYSLYHIDKPRGKSTVAESQVMVWNRGADGHWRESKNFALPGAEFVLGSSNTAFAVVSDLPDRLFKLVDLKSMNTVLQFDLLDPNYWIDISTDGHYLAFSSPAQAGAIFTTDVWDLQTSQRTKHLEHGLVGISSTTFSPDGKYLACLGFSGGAIFSVPGFKRIADIPSRFYGNGSASFAWNNTVIALPIGDKRVQLWDWFNKKDVALLDEPEASDGTIIVSDDSLLLTIGKRQARVYQLTRMTEQLNLPIHAISGSLVAFNPESTIVASVGEAGIATVHDLQTGKKLWETAESGNVAPDLAYSEANIASVAYGPGDLLFTSSLLNGRSLICDDHKHKRFELGIKAPPVIWQAEFTKDGHYLMTMGSTNKAAVFGNLQIWRIERVAVGRDSGSVTASLVNTLDNRNYQGFALAPDNRHFACDVWETNNTHGVYLGDIEDQAPPRFLAAFDINKGMHFDFISDKRQLIMFNTNREVVTFDTVTGQQLGPAFSVFDSKRMGKNPRLVLALSPDGTKLAITARGFGSGVDIWDWKNHSLMYCLPKQDGLALGIAWSPDSQRIAVCHDQSGIKIWNLREVEHQLNKLGIGP